jgi:D-tagatose-1,6-bisphosphate aldolase subunit GatZ/KbaZ
MGDILGELKSEHLAGRRKGLVSVCSARPEVLAAAMSAVLEGDGPLLVEATAAQVNQQGGYTGLTPESFAVELHRLAAAAGFPPARIVAGADHLGPFVWRNEPSATALTRCEELVRRCVGAGFRKLHLDTGFGCVDDPGPVVGPERAVERAIRLCRAAEAAVAHGRSRPFYVIGAEVPVPGGNLEEGALPAVTPVAEVVEVLDRMRAGFQAAGLEAAWERVMAVVVQPGVEFGDNRVGVYRPERAVALSAFHAQLPGIMTYEVHSTDYQPAEALARMTADHFTLLKVGPCLTHAFHEAVLALERLELEWLRGQPGFEASGVSAALEAAMREHPVHWRSHYRGSPAELRRLRQESLRDRVRYYWGAPGVQSALARLRRALKDPPPDRLVERFFPGLHMAAGRPPDAEALIRATVQAALTPYLEAAA